MRHHSSVITDMGTESLFKAMIYGLFTWRAFLLRTNLSLEQCCTQFLKLDKIFWKVGFDLLEISNSEYSVSNAITLKP